MSHFRLWLAEASKNAEQVDFAFLMVFLIAAAIFLLLFVLLVIFAVRYRAGTAARRGPLPNVLRREIEIGWTSATTFTFIFIFWWFVGGGFVPPLAAPNQLEIHVVAKQWMWKAEHPSGAREIDALHIPVDTPIHLVMTSQDVIHSFFVPVFRLKQDVLPARDTDLGFTATQIGEFHLFCAEFCGTQHSHMTGSITVMTPPDYARWLRDQPHGQTLADRGETLFAHFGCGACHAPDSQVNAPKLAGLYGSLVRLQDGRRLPADEAYLRDAILHPRQSAPAGYPAIMPSYAGVAAADDVDALVAYVKSLPAPEARK